MVGYTRCSTEEQATQGVTLEAQRARIVAFCEATERPLHEVVVDAGKSAKSTERPGFSRLLKAVRSGELSTVVVLKIDRATRSVRDLADLMDLFAAMDCAFISVTESIYTGSAAGRMITNLLGVLAQFEREQVGERTSFALKHKRQNLR
ncbi:MAG: recombinase family protein, partial [Candidatus Eremiobacteraeota bacterium]|nr:recombinase family protein [Candidatus Eremiobacteraeota bacterium]